MDEVRREADNELCGFVTGEGNRWNAITVFGGVLSEHGSREEAVGRVVADGLASLAERWTLYRPDGSEQVCCIVEAHPGSAVLALDYYAMPGVETFTITSDMLAHEGWRMTRP